MYKIIFYSTGSSILRHNLGRMWLSWLETSPSWQGCGCHGWTTPSPGRGVALVPCRSSFLAGVWMVGPGDTLSWQECDSCALSTLILGTGVGLGAKGYSLLARVWLMRQGDTHSQQGYT